MKHHKDGEGTGASLTCEERVGAVTVQPGGEKVWGGTCYHCVEVPERRVHRGWSKALLSGAQWQDQGQWTQSETHRRTPFFAGRVSTGCPRRLWGLPQILTSSLAAVGRA